MFEVVGAVVIDGAVEFGGRPRASMAFVEADMEILGTAEHEVLEQMREARLAGPFVLRADVIPDVDRFDRSFVIIVHDHGQAIWGIFYDTPQQPLPDGRGSVTTSRTSQNPDLWPKTQRWWITGA